MSMSVFGFGRRALPAVPAAPLRLVFGVARSGKSSLLYRCLRADLADGLRPLVIDPQEAPPSCRDVLARIGPGGRLTFGDSDWAAADFRRRFAEQARDLLEGLPDRMRPFGAPALSVFLNEPAGFLEPAVAGALCAAAGLDLRLTMAFCSTDSFEALVGRVRAKELLADRSERTATFWLRAPDDPGAVCYALDGLSARQARRLRRAWA